MLTAQRRRAILAAALTGGGVHVGQLSVEYRVSDATIRRDLAALEGQGLVARVHGGAVPATEPLRLVNDHNAAARAIAKRAAALVQPGTTVAITAGPLAIPLARALAVTPGLTVVTNSLLVATALTEHYRWAHNIVLLGGTQTRSGAYVGALTVAATATITADVTYLGVTGMALDTGYTVDDLVEADTVRAMVRCAGRVVVLANRTMWGRTGLATVMPLAATHTLIIDGPPEVDRTLRQAVPELILAV